MHHDFFIAYASPDAPAAQSLHGWLGGEPRSFLDKTGLGAGPWDSSLLEALLATRVIVVLISANTPKAHYQREEIARAIDLARNLPERYGVIPVYLNGHPKDQADIPYGLYIVQGVDVPRVGGLQAAADQIQKLASRFLGAVAPTPVEEPFRRLRPFQPEDKELFYGREFEIIDLVDLASNHRLSVLHGASGTGKTSLLHAGAEPRLRERFLWLRVTPRGDVFEQIERLTRQHLTELGATVPASPDAALLRLSKAVGKPVLLVIDQAEEIFQTLSPERLEEGLRGLATLLASCLQGGAGAVAVHVLLSIRDDYLGHLRRLKDAGLPTLFNDGLLLLPLDRAGTRRAIVEPFRLAGYTVSREVVDKIIETLGGSGAQVTPVELQLVCAALYETRPKGERVIELALYDSLGGAGKVLGTYLQRTLDEFDPGLRSDAKAVLQSLVGPEGIRAQALTVPELARATVLPEERVRSVLEPLLERRLVQPTEVAEDGAARYRLSHDLVARELYARLSEEEKQALTVSHRVSLWSRDWAQRRLPLWLIPATSRQEILTWAERASVPEPLRPFVKAVKRWHTADRRLRQWSPPLVLVLLVSGIILGAQAWQSNKTRDRILMLQQQARDAEAQAGRTLGRNPGRALGLLLSAHEASTQAEQQQGVPPSVQANTFFLARRACEQGVLWPVRKHSRPVPVTALAVTPPLPTPRTGQNEARTRYIASGTEDWEVRVADFDRGGEDLLLARPDFAPSASNLAQLVFSPDGRWLAGLGDASGHNGRGVVVWNTKNWEMHVLRSAGPEEISEITWTPDSQWLVGFVPLLLLWHVDDWRNVPLPADFDVAQVHKLISGSHGGEIVLNVRRKSTGGHALLFVDLPSFERRWFDVNAGHSFDFDLSGDGSLLAVTGGTGLRVFDTRGGGWRELDDNDKLWRMAFARRQPVLFTVDKNGQLLSYNLEEGRFRLKGLESDNVANLGDVGDFAVNANGTVLFSASRSVSMVFPLTGDIFSLDAEQTRAWNVTFLPDEGFVVLGTYDGRVSVWDPHVCTRRSIELRKPHSWLDSPSTLIAGLSAQYELVMVHGFTQAMDDPSSTQVVGNLLSLGLGPPYGLCLQPPNKLIMANPEGIFVLGPDSPDGGLESLDNGPQQYGVGPLCLADGRVVWAGPGGRLHSWAPGSPVPSREQGQDGIIAMNIDPDRKLISLLDGDGGVHLWNPASDSVRELVHSSPPATQMSFPSPDKVAVIDASRNIVLLSIDGGTPSTTVLEANDTAYLAGLAISKDARLAALGRRDSSAIDLIWMQGGHVDVVNAQRESNSALGFSHDGRELLTENSRGHVSVWPLPPLEPEAFRTWLEQHTPWNKDLSVRPFPGARKLLELRMNATSTQDAGQ